MEQPETDSEDEMPPGWEERCTTDGLVFYAHHSSQTTQWQHPRTNKRKKVTGELPYGWERQITEDGKVFFVDHINHKTTYTDPRLAFAVEESKTINDLRQRFDSSSTGLQVLHGRDLTGRVAIVTGANCGIGYETARTLAYHGCTVVFACRSVTKAEEAISKILDQRPNASCYTLHIDLASLESVRTFAQTFAVKFDRCDILILNAGVFGLPHTLTTDGLETTFQINHLSQFYLAVLLQPMLSRSAPARVVFVSAEAHRKSVKVQGYRMPLRRPSFYCSPRCTPLLANHAPNKVACDFVGSIYQHGGGRRGEKIFATLDGACIEDELSPPHKATYNSITAYCNSKLCNVLTALEMQRRFGNQGLNCYAVHPGNAVSTYITRYWWVYRLIYAIVRPFTKSLQQACATSIYCAASTDISKYGGVYVNNCVPCLPSNTSLSSVISNRLWNTSLNIIQNLLGKRAFSVQTSQK